MKNSIVIIREFWAAGDYRSAIKTAAENGKLGDYKAVIQSGWAAAWNPGFYRQLGPNPDTLYRKGLAAMATLYDLEPPPPESIPPLK